MSRQGVKESTYWENAGENAVAEFVNEIAKRDRSHDSLITSEKLKEEKKEELALAVSTEVPQDVNAEKEKLKPEVEESVIFKIQIGSFLNGRVTPAFKTMYNKISKLRKIDEYVDSKKYKIFTIGIFSSYTDATILKNQLILEGVKGAFVVAYKNGKKIPVTDIVEKKPGK